MIKTAKTIIKENIEYRRVLPALAMRDLKKQYNGSVLSWVWGIIRPAILIFTFWFAFSVGLRSGSPKNGYPFFLWLIAGMIPWYYMRDLIYNGCNAVRKYSFLVTKVRFPVSTIPTFTSMSYFVIHFVMTVVMILIFWIFGYPPTVYVLQIPFYQALMFLFFTAWNLFSGMVTIVSKDFLNLIRSLTQALFWLSGILYDVSGIEYDWIRKILMFNPVTIIVNGFRNALIYRRWVWEEPQEFFNFLLIYVLMCILGVWAYKKLREDIPDVL